MKTLLLLSMFVGLKTYAFVGGTLTCHFEILTTHNPSRVEKLPDFTIDITQPYTNTIKNKSLANNLYVSYAPGADNSKDINVFSLDVMYDGADGGSDVPAVSNRNYTFYVSKSGTELIGAYLKCTSLLN